MIRPHLFLPFLLVLLLAVAGPAAGLPPLASPPLGEHWFGIYLNGERTGFIRTDTRRAGDGYVVTAESSVKMVVMGFSREASVKEDYHLRQDLTINTFSVEERLDGSPMRVFGQRAPEGILVTVQRGKGKKEKLLKTKGAVYPSWALNIYPLFKGFAAGKKYRIATLDTEEAKIKQVEVTAVAREKGSDGEEVLHLRNDIYPVVDNDVWVDPAGNTLRESVRDGLVVTVAEDARAASRLVAESLLLRKDLVYDFSMIRITPPLGNPAALSLLRLKVTGLPAGVVIPSGPGQKVTGAPAATTVTLSGGAGEPEALSAATTQEYLQATDRLPADAPEAKTLQAEILKGETDPVKRITKLAGWVAATIRGTVTDSMSVQEVLAKKEGNCQSHARVYVTLARAAGIPSRFVSGLIYSGEGFLYHSWAESYDGHAWVRIDPTFGQVPADVTHLKLAEGETLDDIAPIGLGIGRLRLEVIEKR